MNKFNYFNNCQKTSSQVSEGFVKTIKHYFHRTTNVYTSGINMQENHIYTPK